MGITCHGAVHENAWEVAQVDEEAAEKAHKAALAAEKQAAHDMTEYRRLTGRDPSPAPQPVAGPEPVQLGLFGGGK